VRFSVHVKPMQIYFYPIRMFIRGSDFMCFIDEGEVGVYVRAPVEMTGRSIWAISFRPFRSERK
jgi:hypothetical protein